MRVMQRKFAVAMMLTAMTGVAGLTAAGPAARAHAASSCTAGKYDAGSFQLHLEWNGFYAIAPLPSLHATTFINDVNNRPTYFCSEDGYTEPNGITYYYYNDSNSKCLTVNANAYPAPTYEAPCGAYPASQQWHWNYDGTKQDGTLQNYGTGECMWFTGFDASTGHEKALQPINVGGCTRNENTILIQETNG